MVTPESEKMPAICSPEKITDSKNPIYTPSLNNKTSNGQPGETTYRTDNMVKGAALNNFINSLMDENSSGNHKSFAN